MTGTQVSAEASELIARLMRLEERMNDVFMAVEKLAIRDAEFDASLRSISEQFSLALAAQAEDFRQSLMALTVNPGVHDVRKPSWTPVITFLRKRLTFVRSIFLRRPC